MTNPTFITLDEIRTYLWLCCLFNASGIRRIDQLAKYIQTELQLERYDNTTLKRYATLSQLPIKGSHPYACGDWVKFAGLIWPETSAWFRTPFWYLIQKTNLTQNDLVICANGLPRRFREDLLEPSNGSAALKLITVPKDYLYGFTDPINPWALGALACSMRRAEFAGEAGTMRWALVGIMWSVNHFLETVDPLLRPPLQKLLDFLKNRLDESIYPTQIKLNAPISELDIVRFGRERASFVNYFAACEFTNWKLDTQPPWIEHITKVDDVEFKSNNDSCYRSPL